MDNLFMSAYTNITYWGGTGYHISPDRDRQARISSYSKSITSIAVKVHQTISPADSADSFSFPPHLLYFIF